MNLTIQNTKDGSNTIYSEVFKETYHSINGAITESMHVFIREGLSICKRNPIRIFEVGFGTGLNALLTLIESQRLAIQIEYEAIELYPIENDLYNHLGYEELLAFNKPRFKAIYEASWDKRIEILSSFHLLKIQGDLLKFNPVSNYDLIYFDAFSPVTQPELWTEEIFKKLYTQLNIEGILTTYCAKGVVRRTLEKVGFKTERLPGPPGKREILRAIKK